MTFKHLFPISVDWHTDPSLPEARRYLQEHLADAAANWLQAEFKRLTGHLKRTKRALAISATSARTPLEVGGDPISTTWVAVVRKKGNPQFLVHVGTETFIAARNDKLKKHWAEITLKPGIDISIVEEVV
jgi:hypothetical protein